MHSAVLSSNGCGMGWIVSILEMLERDTLLVVAPSLSKDLEDPSMNNKE